MYGSLIEGCDFALFYFVWYNLFGDVMKNIFYFRIISKIGGTEQFLYEIAKKYKDWDITVFYDGADPWQLKRLRNFVRCKQRVKGKKVICDKAFFNFNTDMIDDVEAKEYYFISHANYEELGYTPPIENKKLTNYVGVSKFSADKLDEFGKKIGKEIKTLPCYNPLTLEPKEKVMHLVSACRLNDVVKGGVRTQKLIQALDRYCEETGRHYLWTIFTNPNLKVKIDSPNVVIMKPRVDVRPYIAEADYVLQLSNDMETYCYTINEALGYGVPIVTTPLSIVKELPIDDNMRIELDYNCSNVDEVARQIFEKKVKPFNYEIPRDDWDKLLEKGKSTYEEEKKMKIKVRALISFNDLEENKHRNIGEEFECSKQRAEFLLEHKAIEIIEDGTLKQPYETIMPQPVEEDKEIVIVDAKEENENIIPLDKEKVEEVAKEIQKHIHTSNSKNKKRSKK